MEWVTTSTILDRLQDHADRDVWDTFSSRFRVPLIAFARKLGIREAGAEEVAQDALMAFVTAFRDGKYDRSKGRLSNWLFGIAHKSILKAKRRLALEHKRFDQRAGHTSFWTELPDEEQASVIWDAEWQRTVLEQCLRQVRVELNEQTVNAFELVVRQGRSADETAAVLNITRNAIYIAKHRVLNRLGELIRGYEDLDFPHGR